jgi:hypothetical protein
MSNQIETAITVQLENRDRKSVLLRIFLVVPIAIFVSAFTAWSGSTEASTFLVWPFVLTSFACAGIPRHLSVLRIGLQSLTSSFVYSSYRIHSFA